MDEIRGQLFDKVEARLKTILVGAVFTLETGESYTCQSSVGNAVWPWRQDAFDPSEGYALYLSDPENDDTEEGVPIGDARHTLLVDAVIELARSQPVDALRKMIADIRACVGIDPEWDGLARWTEIKSDRIEKEEAGHVIVGARVRLHINYDTSRWRT